MLFYDMVFLEFLSVFEQFYTLLCFFCLLYLAHAFCYSLILCNSIHIYAFLVTFLAMLMNFYESMHFFEHSFQWIFL